MKDNYLCLSRNIICEGDYSIKPVRYEDRNLIMKWRNNQIHILRQKNILTQEDQDKYFSEIVSKLFEVEKPDQLLFSFFYKNQLIAYGGLVKINWIDENAEISFLINDTHNNQIDLFREYWLNYLSMIELIAFQELSLKKIYTYAFDLRPYLYEILEEAEYNFEAKLTQHVKWGNNNFIDVIIHSKINK